MSRIGVVVPEYNELSRKILDYGLENFARLAENPLFDVVVVDDSSTDGSREEIRKYMKMNDSKFRVIYRKENGRKVGAIKDGIKALRPNVTNVVLTDFDTRFREESIPKLREAEKELYSDPTMGGGALKVVRNPRGKNKIFQMLQSYEPLSNWGKNKFSNDRKYQHWVAGAGGIWKRDVLEEVLPFHSGNHAGDDIEITNLVKSRGYRIGSFPQVILETLVHENYFDLMKQMKRWTKGSFDNYRMFPDVYMKENSTKPSLKSCASDAFSRWLDWCSLPTMAYGIYNAAATGDASLLISWYLTDTALSSTFMFAGSDGVNKKELATITPLMPFYRLGVSYPSKVAVGVDYLKEKFGRRAGLSERTREEGETERLR